MSFRSVSFRSRERDCGGLCRVFRVGFLAECFDVALASVHARLKSAWHLHLGITGRVAGGMSVFSPCFDASIRHCLGS
ncbi:hypothetical protein AS032_26955 [Rhodococcus qingshengii]|nr:hypothetical protein AOT96_31765 [Rhodococcus sp. 008]KSU70589.1 hypothetical protein AS032_26955 [Rhodococcus qingshengii]